MSERDTEILELLEAHRFLATTHIQRLMFSDHASDLSAARSCRRVVERLRDQGLIGSLERRVGGVRAGSASYIWHLTRAGATLLARRDGEGNARRFHEPSQRLLEHCLMVADIHLAMLAAAVALEHLELEPVSWRSYQGPGGEQRLVRPDLTAVTLSGDYEDHWMLEADTGSEHPPTVVRACRRYQSYFDTGIEQQRHGVIPRVIWVVPHNRRRDKLRDAFARARLDIEVFRVVTLDDLPAVIEGGAS